jgi:hypothetical protein
VVNQVTASTLPPNFEMVLMMPDPADIPVDRAFEVAVFLAEGQRTVSELIAQRDKTTGLHPAETTFVTAMANADHAYTMAESGASATREAARATAIAAHDETEAAAYDAALEALASTSPSPWAGYDAAVADANADYTAVVAPGARDAAIAEINAERDFVQTMAGHERTAILTLLGYKQAHEATVLNAGVARGQTQLTLQTNAAANPNVPLGALGAIDEPQEGETGGGGQGGTGNPPPADPNKPPKAKSFEEIKQKLATKWKLSPGELLRQYFNGVKQGFFDGVKGTFTLVTTWGEYGFYKFTPVGWVARWGQMKAGWDDPIADQEAMLRAFGDYMGGLVNAAGGVWENKELYAVHYAFELRLTYNKVVNLQKLAGQWLESHGDELIEAILTGDEAKMQQLKVGLDPRLQQALDAVYAGAVSIADMAANQLNPYQIGYILGGLLYEACEDVVITAAWGALTAGTAGAAGAASPGVIAARAANLANKMRLWVKKLKIADEFGETLVKTTRDTFEKIFKQTKKVDAPTPKRPDAPKLPATKNAAPELPTIGKKLGCFVAGTPVWLSAVPAQSLVASAVEAALGGDSQAALRGGRVNECWPIETVPLGARVPAKKPSRESYDFVQSEPEQVTWRRIFLRHLHPSGVTVDLELLRPAEWIAEHGLEVGRTLPTSMPDMRFRGEVTVLEVAQCPPIADGPGSVVTGRFITECAPALANVTFADGTELVGTPWHPVWSSDRQEWIGLADLARGEHVAIRAGSVAVAQVKLLDGDESVYNIEVHGEHVYEVTELGVLVHNNNCWDAYVELVRKRDLGLLNDADRIELDRLERMFGPGKMHAEELLEGGGHQLRRIGGLERRKLNRTTEAIIEAAQRKNPAGEYLDKNLNVIKEPSFGHKFGFEHARIVKQAERLGLNQGQFDDFVNAHPHYIEIQEWEFNRSHRGEMHGPDPTADGRILRDMEKFFGL